MKTSSAEQRRRRARHDRCRYGRLGIAVGEAVEVAAERDGTSHAPGSMVNHVLLHQTVIRRLAGRFRGPSHDEAALAASRAGLPQVAA